MKIDRRSNTKSGSKSGFINSILKPFTCLPYSRFKCRQQKATLKTEFSMTIIYFLLIDLFFDLPLTKPAKPSRPNPSKVVMESDSGTSTASDSTSRVDQ